METNLTSLFSVITQNEISPHQVFFFFQMIHLGLEVVHEEMTRCS